MNASAATFSVSVQPSGIQFEAQAGESLLAAGIRQGIGLPYGCKDGACGSCKCKLVSGQVQHSNFQRKALSEEEEAQGFVLTCSARAQSDITLESRQVTPAGALPIKKMPTRVSSLARKTEDVVLLQLQLPANDSFVYRAGQYVEFILRDGARRSYSMANAPLAEKELTALEVGAVTAFLVSPLASAVTGITMYVDNGLHSVAVAGDTPSLADAKA